jgi:hypothetical protein
MELVGTNCSGSDVNIARILQIKSGALLAPSCHIDETISGRKLFFRTSNTHQCPERFPAAKKTLQRRVEFYEPQLCLLETRDRCVLQFQPGISKPFTFYPKVQRLPAPENILTKNY